VIQGVPGVAYVDIDAFGGVTEKIEKYDNQEQRVRALRSPDEIAEAVAQIIDPSGQDDFSSNRVDAFSGGSDRVDAFPGGSDHGLLRPAELVIFTPAVSDTLILNQLP
jgi:hypothetical protein